jgi:hypothetical protein
VATTLAFIEIGTGMAVRAVISRAANERTTVPYRRWLQ